MGGKAGHPGQAERGEGEDVSVRSSSKEDPGGLQRGFHEGWGEEPETVLVRRLQELCCEGSQRKPQLRRVDVGFSVSVFIKPGELKVSK